MKKTRTALPHAWQVLLFAGAATLLILTSGACDPGPYGTCTLPSSEALKESCTPAEGGTNEAEGEIDSAATCVVDFVFECESQLCGTFKGSDAFCTERCTGEGDTSCPENGVCLEWVPGLGEYFCVPQDMAETAQQQP